MSDPIKFTGDGFAEFCHREDPVDYPKGKNGKFQCPCCYHFTLEEVAGYNICPVCFWEDDGTTGEHAFSPNGIELTEARANYQKFGANTERDLKHCRPPLTDEIL
jgi:Cysteine-rich CPCC